MSHRLLICATALTLCCTAPAFAQHLESCEALAANAWKPQAELERKLVNQGWKVSRVKITNGCYEVYGRDEKGAKVEVFFHPRDLALVTAPVTTPVTAPVTTPVTAPK